MVKVPVPVRKKEEETLFTINLKPQIPRFPDVPNNQLDLRYPLIEPYAFAHLYWDKTNKELTYDIEEPVLTEDEKVTLDLIEEGIKELINVSYLSVKEGETVIKYLEKNLRVLLNELKISITKESYLKLMYYIYRDFVGLGKVEPLLCDYFIEDIECNGTNFPIYVVHRKYRNLKTNIMFHNAKKLTGFVERLAQKCGQYISYATPLLDASLPDGSRCNATFTEDISTRGPTFTIRKFTKYPWSPTMMIALGTISPQLLAFLWILIEYEMNIMVVGGTGSGKTTMLNSLTFFIPPQARIVSIEDTRELNLQHSNWLPSVARPGVGLTNLVGQKYGEVSLFDLLKESFRQNPDYVIVGEIRGKEAFVLFQGMSSGHPSFGTMHANSVDTMIKRLITPPINLSPSLVEAMDAVCVMVNTKVKGKQVRRLKELFEVVSVKQTGEAVTNSPFVWDPKTDTFYFKSESHVFNKLVLHYGMSKEDLYREFRLRTDLLLKLYQGKIFDFKQVQEIINEYYKDPKSVLAKYKVI